LTVDRHMIRSGMGRQGHQMRPLGRDWECVVIDPRRIQVESICPDEDLANTGLHWFQVFFKTGSGRCFITAGEAQRLRPLSTAWVERALSNLARMYGTAWLEHTMTSNPGL
jgi:hypothetical protein